MAAILRFTVSFRKEWSNSENAEFARAVALLRRSGLPISCEFGTSDEGDPWVVFLRDDTGDVVAHIARIDGRVTAASAATSDVVVGPTLRSVMERILSTQPLVLPNDSVGRVYLHPSAVIVAFIATALAWAQKEDMLPYDVQALKATHDGVIGMVLPKDMVSGGVLRDSIMSKSEIIRLGLEASHTLTEALNLAAAVAAVAFAVKSIDFLIDDDRYIASLADSLFRLPEPDHRPNNNLINVAAVADDLDHRPAQVQKDLQPTDDQGVQPPANVHDASHEHVLKIVADANPHDQQPGSPEQVATHSTIVLPSGDEPANLLPVNAPSQLPPEGHSDAAAAAAAHPATDSVLPAAQPDGLKLPVHGSSFALSSEGTDFLNLMLAPRHQAGDVPAAQSAASGTIDGTIEISLPTPGTAGPDTGNFAPTPASYDQGVQLASTILSFAFDSHHDMSTSSADLAALQQALRALPFLPAADRVLVIDVPDLRTDTFRFVDGLTVMSQEAMAKVLPTLDLHPQAELALTGGGTLKLIGVIELHPTTGAVA